MRNKQLQFPKQQLMAEFILVLYERMRKEG